MEHRCRSSVPAASSRGATGCSRSIGGRRHGHGVAGPRRAAGPAGGDQADRAPARGRRRTSSDQQRQRALREGRIAARLSHPHAISVYDVALEGGQPWLVMEYLPSRSLAPVLTEDGVAARRTRWRRSAPRWPTPWPPRTRPASCTAT